MTLRHYDRVRVRVAMSETETAEPHPSSQVPVSSHLVQTKVETLLRKIIEIECIRKQKRRKKGRYGASFLFTSKKTCMRNLDVNNKDGIVELYNMLCYLIRTIAGYTSLLVKG